jgi:hypothetical protein
MIHSRLSFFILAIAGIACAQAQTPIVKINASTSECDVTANPGDPIFTFDASGNVLINGSMSGAGCGGSGGGTGTVSFAPFNPAPAPLAVSPTSITVGNSANLSYAAAYATSCNVTAGAGTLTTGTGSCPSVSISSAACSGTGSPVVCSNGNGSASEPTALDASSSCRYVLTATCNPGGVTSTASFTVNSASGGGGGDPGGNFGTTPAACTGGGAVASLDLAWQKNTTLIWLPGQGSTNISDATDYRNIYSFPTSPPSPQPWPSGSSGVKPTFGVNKNGFLALGFTVPSGTSGIAADYFNVNSGSQPVALTISECPGDFGQQGTHISTAYCKCDRTGCGGLVGYVGTAVGTCPLTIGKTYYLNIIDAGLPPAGSTTQPTSACAGSTCNAQVELTH